MAREELFAALVEEPEEPERYLVYADALQAAGDRHGELIVLQITGGAPSAERELRAELEREVIGDVPGIRVSWRHGFVSGIDIAREAVEHVIGSRWLASHRALALVREVRFDQARPAPQCDVAAMIDTLVDAPAAATIARVAIGNRRVEPPPADLLVQLVEGLPRLRGLELGATVAPALAPLRGLSALTLWVDQLPGARLDELAELRLQQLVLGSDQVRPWPELVAALDAIGELGGLEHLALMFLRHADPLVEDLPARPIWRGLRSLGLPWSELTPAGEQRLADHRSAFADKQLTWPLPAGRTAPAEHPFRIGMLLRLRLDRPADALPHYETMVATRDDVAAYWFAYGNLLAQLERPADAVRAFDRAIELESGHASALFNRGRALIRLGRLADATSSLERATAANPRHANAWQELGLLHRRLGRLDEALRCFETATGVEPTHHAGRDLFDTLLEYGHPERALAHVERLLAAQPDDAQLARKHGRALLRLGRPADALAIAERAREPDGYYNQYLRFAALRDLGRHAEALAVCDRIPDAPCAILQRALLDDAARIALPAGPTATAYQRATAAIYAVCAASIERAGVEAARESLAAILRDGVVLDRAWDLVDTIDQVSRARPEHAELIARCYAVATGRVPLESLASVGGSRID